jgi:3-oxoacyl-[acyl-carrier-protein] synthase III
MTTRFDNIWVESTGHFLPGAPVDNDTMDAYIAPIHRISGRIKKRILAENGIQTRHYAIGPDGQTLWSNAQLASEALRRCLAAVPSSSGPIALRDVSLLATGTSGGDSIMPGFASMVQGELAAPPMQTHSSVGVCAASVSALAFAAGELQLASAEDLRHGPLRALVVGSDLPSRMFKASRFTPQGRDADFDAHFLRWMLSDGAGALLLRRDGGNAPLPSGPRLALRWVHSKSFAGDYPTCMQLGMPHQGSKSYLDYASASEAEVDGAMALRQDIRLLPHLFDVGIHEYAKLVDQGDVHPSRVNHFLCHYSSQRFRPVVDDLMHKAGLAIPPERWWSNLATRGNTGAASIFVMLSEFVQTHDLKPGETIFCFVPESGRFTVAYMLFEVMEGGVPATHPRSTSSGVSASQGLASQTREPNIPAPHSADDLPPDADPQLAKLLRDLADVWHRYRSRAWRTPLLQAVRERRMTASDYQRWMACWIPQVREGSFWMREAMANMTGPYAVLSSLIEQHAGEEQFDFKILFNDYRVAGGPEANMDVLRRNPGGEALNSFLHAMAATPNAVGLLGAIYMIEGTGQRIIPALLPLLQAQLRLPPNAFRFLQYHGANDENHLNRWLQAVKLVLAADVNQVTQAAAARSIVNTAEQCAELYLLQMQHAYGQPSLDASGAP